MKSTTTTIYRSFDDKKFETFEECYKHQNMVENALVKAICFYDKGYHKIDEVELPFSIYADDNSMEEYMVIHTDKDAKLLYKCLKSWTVCPEDHPIDSTLEDMKAGLYIKKGEKWCRWEDEMRKMREAGYFFQQFEWDF